jgi:hypothetical protein
MSLEVGEHLPAQYEGVFLDNVVRHAVRNVLLSWAVPNQGGHLHINEKPNTVVIEQMKLRGFEYDEEESLQLRDVATLTWFKNTLMVFRRASAPPFAAGISS